MGVKSGIVAGFDVKSEQHNHCRNLVAFIALAQTVPVVTHIFSTGGSKPLEKPSHFPPCFIGAGSRTHEWLLRASTREAVASAGAGGSVCSSARCLSFRGRESGENDLVVRLRPPSRFVLAACAHLEGNLHLCRWKCFVWNWCALGQALSMFRATRLSRRGPRASRGSCLC
jgi:hypothetical protein